MPPGIRWRSTTPDTEYRHTGLTAGVTYHYRVAAVNRHGTGEWSEAEATTSLRPGAPTRLTATARGTSRIELDWNAPSSVGGSIARVSDRSLAHRNRQLEGARDQHALANQPATRTPIPTSNPARRATTGWRRSTAPAIGGDWSNIDDATTDAARPGAPLRLRVTPGGLGGRDRLVLSWTRPSSDGGSPITGYRIGGCRKRESRGGARLPQPVAGTTTYTHLGLEPGMTRHYRVAAINARGASGPWSEREHGTTNASAPSQPQAPRASATGPRSITLSWDPPLDDGGKPRDGATGSGGAPAAAAHGPTIRSNTGSTGHHLPGQVRPSARPPANRYPGRGDQLGRGRVRGRSRPGPARTPRSPDSRSA